MIVYAVLGEEKGQTLKLLDDPQYSPEGPKGVTPGYVRHEILAAIAAGWDHQTVGGEFNRDMRRRAHMGDIGRPLKYGMVNLDRLRLRVHAEPGLLDYEYPWEHLHRRWHYFRFFYAMKPIQAGTILAKIADYNGISPLEEKEAIFRKLAGQLPLDTDPGIAAKMRPNYEIAGGIAIIQGTRRLLNYGRGVDSSQWMTWWQLANDEVLSTWNGHDPSSGAFREGDTIVLKNVYIMREREYPLPMDRYATLVDQLEEDIEGGLDVLQEWLEQEAPEDTQEIIMEGIREAIYAPLREDEAEDTEATETETDSEDAVAATAEAATEAAEEQE
ncbi:MAG: hypothetical protein AAGN35_00195 [Bacteroidota bacterium]